MGTPSANDLLTGKGARWAGTDDGIREDPATRNADLALLKIMWERLGWDPPLEHITEIDRNTGARYESQRHNPKVVPPGRDKQLIYYSPTKTSQMPDGERWALNKWNERQVAKGVALDHGLQDQIIAYQDDDEAVDRLVGQAKTRAKADQGAVQGTARHKVAEKIDFGINPGPLSPRVRADLDAYRAVTHGLDMVLAEVFVVYDLDKMGGTLDRVAYYPATGRYHIVDLKPPDSGFGQGERAIQFGIYSRSQPYNWNLAQFLLETNRKALKVAELRTELPQPLDLERAIMVHVPRGGGRAFTAWVDIDQGWNNGFDIARRMRRWQNRDFQESLVTPFEVQAPPVVLDVAPTTNGRPPRSEQSVQRTAQLAGATGDNYCVHGRIGSCDECGRVRPEVTIAEQPLPVEKRLVAHVGGVTEVDETDPAHPHAIVADKLRKATTVKALGNIWRQAKRDGHWTDDHTTLAGVLKAQIQRREAPTTTETIEKEAAETT